MTDITPPDFDAHKSQLEYVGLRSTDPDGNGWYVPVLQILSLEDVAMGDAVRLMELADLNKDVPWHHWSRPLSPKTLQPRVVEFDIDDELRDTICAAMAADKAAGRFSDGVPLPGFLGGLVSRVLSFVTSFKTSYMEELHENLSQAVSNVAPTGAAEPFEVASIVSKDLNQNFVELEDCNVDGLAAVVLSPVSKSFMEPRSNDDV